jgi:transposase
MSAKRLSMRKTKEVLRLWFDQGLSHRAIARSCSVNHRTVTQYVRRFEEAGLAWPLPEEMDEAALYKRLFPAKEGRCWGRALQMPEMNYLHQELKRPGVDPRAPLAGIPRTGARGVQP